MSSSRRCGSAARVSGASSSGVRRRSVMLASARESAWDDVRGHLLATLEGEGGRAIALEGVSLRVVSLEGGADGDGKAKQPAVVFDEQLGSGAVGAGERVAVASAAKIVTGLVLMRLVEEGALRWDDSLASALGWNAAEANEAATVDQLGAFVGGINAFNPVVFSTDVTLREAVGAIARDSGPFAAPGATFAYSGSQMHALAAIAEARTGKGWNALFDEFLKRPLGLGEDRELIFTTLPNERAVSLNPMVAGGLIASIADFTSFLSLILSKGVATEEKQRAEGWKPGQRLISEETIERFFTNPYVSGVSFLLSPFSSSPLCGESRSSNRKRAIDRSTIRC